MTDHPTQHQQILRYIKDHGSITSIEAATHLFITDGRKRISELREMGHDLEGTWEEKKNRYGVPVRFKRWRLVNERDSSQLWDFGEFQLH